MPYTPRPYVPDVDTTPRPLPPSLMAVTCAEAFGWWIECRCTGSGCYGGASHLPLRRLIERHRCADRRLLDVAARLRCQRCRSKPTGLRLISDPQRMPSAHSGIPPGGGSAAIVHDLLPLLALDARGASAALPVTGTTWLVPFTRGDLERDPAKRRLLQETFALERIEGGPLLGADRGLGGGKLGTRKG